MPMQIETPKTGPLYALRRPAQTKCGQIELPNSQTQSKPGSEKLIRSKEWRNAYRRLSFILDPFKRRSKSADPRAHENGPKERMCLPDAKVLRTQNHKINNNTIKNVTPATSIINEVSPTTDNKNVPVNGSISASVPSSVSFPQPNLFAVSNGHDSRPEASSYVSPVDITGHLFEQYRRARCTGTLGPLTPQSGEQNHQICGRARFAQQSTPDWAHSSTRPASFHPVLPQRDEICQPQAHHNPYAYQNHRSSSDLGDGDRTSDNRNPYNPTPPQSIRSESVPGVAGPRVAESSRTNSIMCESLYDYPPSLSPYPCPTFNPETEAIGRVKARASSLLPPTRKRVPRPASIDPFLLLAPGSRATKPPPRPDPSDSGYQLTSRGHNHSTDRCGQPSVFTDRELGPSNGNSTVKNTPTTVPVFNFKPSSSVASEEQTCTLSSPLLHPIYPNFGRPQSGDSSSAICQVTVCHSAPKLCATVAETVTGMQRRPNPCLISRPRSTFLPGVDLVDRSSDPVRSRLTTTTARPRPELYLISARNSTRQADTTPQPNGDPVDLDWTVGSNTASSTSVRQRRSRDATDRIGVLCPKESPVRTTRTSSSDFRTNFNNEKKLNGFGDRRSVCACEASTLSSIPIGFEKTTRTGQMESTGDSAQPLFWNSIPEGNEKFIILNGNSRTANCPVTRATNRNSWAAQLRVSGLPLKETNLDTTHEFDASNLKSPVARNSWSVGPSAGRPTSVVLVPNPVCLPPPLGSRANVRSRMPLDTSVSSSSNFVSSTSVCLFPTAGLSAETARRYRTPTVPGVRPPRPPTRTTSLVRGGESESREASVTPPTEPVGTSIRTVDMRSIDAGSIRESAKFTQVADHDSVSVNPISTIPVENISPVCTVSTPVNTTTATAAAVSGDVTSDPRDRLADTEVEQTVADQDSVWWLSLLPYKPSNLPTNLADRLRQRNSLVLARCSPSARLSNSSLPTTLPHLVHPTPPSSTQPPGIGSRLGVPIHLAGESLRSQPMMMMMMTQSLYEQRDPPDQAYMTSSDQLSPPDMTTPRGSRQELRSGRPSRYRLPTRPSSLYVDKPDPPAILMPSLAHLSAIGCSSSGETGLSRPGTLWDRRASAGHINQSDGSSSGPGTSPSPSGDSNFATEGPTDPLSMLSSYTSTTIPPTDPILTKTWSAEKTDSPLLGQYCRLLNLRTVQSNPTGPGASATNSDLPTPSAETPLTPV